MEVLVRRLPVFDRSEQLYGYELLLQRIGERPSGAEPSPEQFVVDVFLGIGLDQVAPEHRAFITVDRDILLGDAVRLLPKDRVVLQLVGQLSDDDELLAACDRLVWSGYRLSVESETPEKIPESLLRLSEIVRLDVSRYDRGALPDMATGLRRYHSRLMARHVRNREDRDALTNLGFELFEGYQSGVSKTLTRRSLPTDHLLIFRLLKKIRDPKATDPEIEDILRGDVGLSYKLLRMVNSAAFGGREIWSIGHALRLLGREQVARWLGLLLVVGGEQQGVRAELTSLSLVRARMCELLATASGVPRAGGSLFLVRSFGHRFHVGQPVRLALILGGDAELLDPAKDDVEPSVREPLGVRDHARASNLVDGRPARVVGLVTGLQQHHSDDPIAGERISDHRAIA